MTGGAQNLVTSSTSYLPGSNFETSRHPRSDTPRSLVTSSNPDVHHANIPGRRVSHPRDLTPWETRILRRELPMQLTYSQVKISVIFHDDSSRRFSSSCRDFPHHHLFPVQLKTKVLIFRGITLLTPSENFSEHSLWPTSNAFQG